MGDLPEPKYYMSMSETKVRSLTFCELLVHSDYRLYDKHLFQHPMLLCMNCGKKKKINISIYLCLYMIISVSIPISRYLYLHLTIYISVYIFTCIYISVYGLSSHLSVYVSVSLSIILYNYLSEALKFSPSFQEISIFSQFSRNQ